MGITVFSSFLRYTFFFCFLFKKKKASEENKVKAIKETTIFSFRFSFCWWKLFLEQQRLAQTKKSNINDESCLLFLLATLKLLFPEKKPQKKSWAHACLAAKNKGQQVSIPQQLKWKHCQYHRSCQQKMNNFFSITQKKR